MELCYKIIKNVYKTYTKRINSIYKFLIGFYLTDFICSTYKLSIICGILFRWNHYPSTKSGFADSVELRGPDSMVLFTN